MRLDVRRLFPRLKGSPSGPDTGTDPGSVETTSVAQASLIPSATSSAAGPPPTDVIDFDENTNFANAEGGRVFLVDDSTGVGSSDKAFRWSVTDNSVTIKDVAWLGMRDDDADEFEKISTAEPYDGNADADEDPFSSVTPTQATLDLSAMLDDDRSVYLKHPMAIRVDWETDDYTGYAQSGVFAVLPQSEGSTTEITDLNEILNNLDSSVVDGTASAGLSTSTASASLGAHPSATDNGAGPVETTEVSDSDADSGGGSGGLSTGAIAGIAVGAGVVVIAAIVALVWFCIRRRRQNRLRAGYAPQETTNTLMAEKEANQTVGGAGDDSPRSPYSDDGHIQQVPPLESVAARHGEQTAYTPYDDPPAARDASPDADQQGVSRSVAHLVEDGMTADEIRRLEEEERQLDAEIERAGRR